MIRYKRLYESENSDIDLYDIVSCAGYDWYVIEIEGDVVSLLAKDDVFGRSEFGEDFKDYENSEVRSYLLSKVLTSLKRNGVNPLYTKLRDLSSKDQVYLLSYPVASQLPMNVGRFNNHDWWIRPLKYGKPCTYVSGNSGHPFTGFGYMPSSEKLAVRPAMRVRIEDLD